MKKYSTVLSALLLSASVFMSGCSESSDSNNSSESAELELEQSGKVLMFYSTSSNNHIAYEVDDAHTTDLNTDTEMTNFVMNSSDKGKFFIWVDNKGDDNASNDEEKVVMFNQDYSFAKDGNATYEDFYYLGHFHEEEENGETHNHIAAHTNEEFDLSDVPAADLATHGKHIALNRLNTYLSTQSEISTTLETKLSELTTSTTLCGMKSITNDNGTRYYAMGVNGKLYVYDDAYTFIDGVQITDSCEVNKMGISAVSHHDENGVLVFENNSQKLYLVDSHDGGIYHVHSTVDASKVVGTRSVEMMASLVPMGYEPDEDHDH